MASLLNLQTLFIAPRNEQNPRIAKLDESRFSKGRDGVLYKMSDSRDWDKYYTLSDREMKDELKRSQEVKRNMMTMSQGTYGGTHRNKMKTAVKMVAPQFGTQTRSRRIEQRQWTKDLANASHGQGTGKMDAKYRDTMATLQHNTELDLPPETEEFEFIVEQSTDKENKTDQAFRVIKQKYEQNLHVIDTLYEERISLEEYTRSLKKKLLEVTGKPVDDLLPSYETLAQQPLPASFTSTAPAATLAPAPVSAPVASGKPPVGREFGYSAAQAADMLGPAFSEEPRGRHRQRASTGTGEQLRSRSLPRSGLSVTSSQRSLSASRGISPHLQADIDLYVQKRKLFDEKERMAKLVAEEEEAIRRERLLNASTKGREFPHMAEQAQKALADKAKKEVDRQKAEKKAQQTERDERAEKKRKEAELMAKALQASTSWQELQDTQEAERREKIETRKQQLLLMSALPNALAESAARVRRTPKPIEEPDFKPRIIAEDPEVVSRRLANQQKAWTQRLSQTKEKLREEFQQRSVTASTSFTDKMNTRAAKCQSNRDDRLQNKYKEDAKTRKLKERQEKLKRDKLLNMKLPESSLKATKAATLRQEKVKGELLDRELEEHKEQRLREKHAIRLKEAAAALRGVIQGRDEDLRARNPNARMELSAAENDASARAAQAREEYRAKLRENKQQIRASLKNRPSLLERHDQSVASRSAATQALRTLTNIITQGDGDDMDNFENMLEGKSSRKNSRNTPATANGTIDALLQGDDFFDTKEKVIVKNMLGK